MSDQFELEDKKKLEIETPHVHGPNCNHEQLNPFVRQDPKIGRMLASKIVIFDEELYRND